MYRIIIDKSWGVNGHIDGTLPGPWDAIEGDWGWIDGGQTTIKGWGGMVPRQ